MASPDLEVKRGRREQLDVSAHRLHARARDGAGVQIAEAVDGALPIRAPSHCVSSRKWRRAWPELAYEDWSATCDTLHAHTQVLGKFAVALAPPEPQLQHAALRLTARGWDTAPLPAPDGSGAFVVALDLHSA